MGAFKVLEDHGDVVTLRREKDGFTWTEPKHEFLTRLTGRKHEPEPHWERDEQGEVIRGTRRPMVKKDAVNGAVVLPISQEEKDAKAIANMLVAITLPFLVCFLVAVSFFIGALS